ncbi:hypothetical protein O1L68_31460 [Streptomyces lydicus]|nr:hypothetical protein [Streptomyces lydicus]
MRLFADYGRAPSQESTPAPALQPQRQAVHAHVNACLTMTRPVL